jgi:PhnB protein
MFVMTDPIPEGFHTITPYFIVENAYNFMQFLIKAFNATTIVQDLREDGSIWHAQMQIGDSMIELSQSTPKYPPTRMNINIFVKDVDLTYQNALATGVTSISEPSNKFYGHREASLADLYGNTWHIASKIEDLTDEEIERRKNEFMRN